MLLQPIRYGFEGLVSNEFHTLNGTCSNLIPRGAGYEDVSLENQVCGTVGAIPGQNTVDGNRFIALSYDYSYSQIWRVSYKKPAMSLVRESDPQVELWHCHRFWRSICYKPPLVRRVQHQHHRREEHHAFQAWHACSGRSRSRREN